MFTFLSVQIILPVGVKGKDDIITGGLILADFFGNMGNDLLFGNIYSSLP